LRVGEEPGAVFNADPRQELGECQPGGLLKHLAEIETSGIGNSGQAQIFGMMRTDEVFCLGNHWRLSVIALDHDSVAYYLQVFGKNGQQLNGRRMLLTRHDARFEIRFSQNGLIKLHSPARKQFERALELRLSRLLLKHLSGPQKANQPAPQPQRNNGFG
jgi:hypothetical protein